MCLGAAGRIVRFEDPDHQTATVDFDGTHKLVNTGMVAGDADPPGPGDWVMVHLGIALERMEPDEVQDQQTSYDDLMAEFDVVAAERDAAVEGDGQPR